MAPIRRPTRRALRTALAAVALAGFILGGLAQLRMETSVSSFLPTRDPVVAQLDNVARSFGGDPIVVLVEGERAGRQLDQQHLLPLLALEGRLSLLPGVATVYGPGTVLNQIAGHMQDLLAELSGRRDAIRAKDGEAAARAFDKRYGSLIVHGLPAGLPTVRNGKFVTSVIYGPDGDPRPQWRFIAPNSESVAVLVRPRQGLDEHATRALADSVRHAVEGAKLDARRVTVTGVPVVATGLSAQVQREIPLLGGLAVLAIAGCFLAVPWAPLRRKLLPLASTLIAVALTVATFGWLGKPVSLGVLAFLSVLLGIGSYYPLYLAQHARPRLVVTVVAATAASFATLLLSPLPFVRDLGLTLALGVLLAAATGAVLVGRRAVAPPPSPDPPARAGRSRYVAAAVGITVVAAVGWLALPGMPVEGSFHRFAGGLPELADAERVEGVVGASGELDVVLRGPDVLTAEAFAWAQRAHDRVIKAHGDQLRSVLSPSRLMPFLGREPSRQQIGAGVRLLPGYLTSAVFRSDRKVALLSFGVRQDDVAQLQALREDVRTALPPPPEGYRVELTGLPMTAAQATELVAANRLLANLAGILAAGVVLAVGLRRRADALRAVVAAAIAAGAGLVALQLSGTTLSPITVVFGSLTAAVACEFTVLLAEAHRRGSPGLRRTVVLAAGTSALGYAVLTASQLPAIREFGALLTGSALIALGVAWIVTRATIAAPQTPVEQKTPQNDLVEVGAR